MASPVRLILNSGESLPVRLVEDPALAEDQTITTTVTTTNGKTSKIVEHNETTGRIVTTNYVYETAA